MAKLETSARLDAVDRASAKFGRVGRSIRRSIVPALGKASRAASRAAKTLGKVGAAAIAIGAPAVAYGVLKLVNSTAELGDSLDKVSKRAGVSVQMLAELRHAAQLGGASSEELDKGLEKFSRTLGDLEAGTGALNTFLAKTSPHLAKLLKSAKSTDEAVEIMLGALAEIPDQSRRNALAAAAFGRAGQKMTIMVREGTAALDASRASFRKYFGPISKEGVAAAVAYTDAQTEVNTAIAGAKFAIGRQLLPVLTPLLTKLADWIAANRDLVASKVSEYIGGLATWISEVDWTKVLQGVEDFFTGVGDVLRFLWDIKGVLLAIGGAMVLGKVVTVLGSVVTAAKTMFGWFSKTKVAAEATAVASAATGRGGVAAGAGKGFGLGAAASVALPVAAVAAAGTLAEAGVRSVVGEEAGDVIFGPDIDKLRQTAVEVSGGLEALGLRIDKTLSDEELTIDIGEQLGRLAGGMDVRGAREYGFGSTVAANQAAAAWAQALKPLFESQPRAEQVLQAAKEQEVKGEIRLKVEGATEGLRVESVKQTGSAGVKLKADVGRRPLAAAAGA